MSVAEIIYKIQFVAKVTLCVSMCFLRKYLYFIFVFYIVIRCRNDRQFDSLSLYDVANFSYKNVGPPVAPGVAMGKIRIQAL